jgi:hypothetical protein
MSTRRTDTEIATEVAALMAVKDRVPPMTAFGDDNREAISAQIDVLNERMDIDQVHGRFGEDAFIDPDEFDEYILDSAIQAHDWMHGLQAEDIAAPSADWGSIAR